jgi:septal ring factor EnvC (AmiA/AmiB activator)
MNDRPAGRKDIEEILRLLGGFVRRTDTYLGKMESEINGVKSLLANLKSSHDHLLNKLDNLERGINKLEAEQAAEDGQRKKLDWAYKVSKRSGIPPENL